MTSRGDFTANRRLFLLSVISIFIGAFCAVVAWALLALINLFTNIFYFQRPSFQTSSPFENHLGLIAIFIPAIGGLIIGLMARFGSEKIRGHGIPEALEAILYGKSIIHPKVAILKPLSSAISIGSGGPFGAEGPIIMTGGAFGSLISRAFAISAAERKTLLVAGAAAGMSATFSAPVASVLLAVELLLFEWKPRSLVPVAVAACIAAGLRPYFLGNGPLFPIAAHLDSTPPNLWWAALVGIFAGLFSTLLSSSLYKVEDLFLRLPFHWMWWPVVGGLIVGIGGYFQPHALGVGYDVIGEILQGNILPTVLAGLITVKAIIWIVSLASGTSGGVLAPLLMMGASLGLLASSILPGHHPLWPMISMAAVLGGMMRAPFTAVIFAVELTHEFSSLTALLVASISAYGFTVLMMKRSILTEKIARRGLDIFREYSVDPLEKIQVQSVMSNDVGTINASMPIKAVVSEFFSVARKHRGYPVVDSSKNILGVLTNSDLLKLTPEKLESLQAEDLIKRQPVTIPANSTCKIAAEMMAEHQVGRLLVTDPKNKKKLVGIITRSDLLKPRLAQLQEEAEGENPTPFEQFFTKKGEFKS
jgi:H+/Cl- antiporter ClcA/CBS domain-containing protein